jgi:hypothetical protein
MRHPTVRRLNGKKINSNRMNFMARVMESQNSRIKTEDIKVHHSASSSIDVRFSHRRAIPWLARSWFDAHSTTLCRLWFVTLPGKSQNLPCSNGFCSSHLACDIWWVCSCPVYQYIFIARIFPRPGKPLQTNWLSEGRCCKFFCLSFCVMLKAGSASDFPSVRSSRSGIDNCGGPIVDDSRFRTFSNATIGPQNHHFYDYNP